METFKIKVRAFMGIHVRNAILLSQKCAQYQSDIEIGKGEGRANGKKVMEIMILRVGSGDTMVFFVKGGDEKKASFEIRRFCRKNF